MPYLILDAGYWMLDAGRSMPDTRKPGKCRESSIKCQESSIKTGFTLIEVTIVIFIIVMMTSITVPWMKTFAESTRLRSTARSIRSLMEFARSSSVAQRTEYVVIFDSNQGQYWLSLLEFLEQGSEGSAVTDSSRTNLSESLASLSESDEEEGELADEEEEIEGAYSRTGGILGIPKDLPASISIAQMSSPRTLAGQTGETEYITFYPDGTAEDFEIYLQSQSGRVFSLTVKQATGWAAIRELTTEEIDELGLELSSE